MEIIKDIWRDIRRGENIDQYITIALAFGLAISNVLGITPSSFILPFILAVLGLLAISSLVNRHHSEMLFEKLTQVAQSSIGNVIDDAGLVAYYPTRELANPVLMIKDAKNQLDFIGTSVPDIADDHGWSALRHQLYNNHSMRIRVLLLNPHSVMACKKQDLYRTNDRDIIIEVHRSISIFKSIYDEFRSKGLDISGRYDVRVYSAIPTTSCAFNDNYLNISFYDELQPASITPAWVFKKNDKDTCLYNYYHRNFESIWSNAVSIFNSEYQNLIRRDATRELEGIKKLLAGDKFSRSR